MIPNPQGVPSNSSGNIVVDGVAYEQEPDIGIGINKAYAALPPGGGSIILPPGSFNFTTPIVFGTANKPATLVGSGYGTSLTYTPTSGTAMVMNYGPERITNHPRGGGIRDVRIFGPTKGSTTGLFLGGSNGAEGFVCNECYDQRIQHGRLLWRWTWATEFNQSIIRDAGSRLLSIGDGVKESGEEISFFATTFIQDMGRQDAFLSAISVNNSDFDVNLVIARSTMRKSR